MIRIAGTGTRSIAKDKDLMRRLVAAMVNALQKGVDEGKEPIIISGGAEGLDEAIAVAAIIAEVPLHLYLPNEGYADYYWRRNSVLGVDRYSEFEELMAAATSIEYSSDTLYTTRNGKRMHSNFARNIDMVHDAHKMWVYWVEGSRGTLQCMKYAISLSRPLYRWDLRVNDH